MRWWEQLQCKDPKAHRVRLGHLHKCLTGMDLIIATVQLRDMGEVVGLFRANNGG